MPRCLRMTVVLLTPAFTLFMYTGNLSPLALCLHSNEWSIPNPLMTGRGAPHPGKASSSILINASFVASLKVLSLATNSLSSPSKTPMSPLSLGPFS